MAPRLIAVPYVAPEIPPSGQLTDVIRGVVTVCGTSSAPIPWPTYKLWPNSRAMPVVCVRLGEAIRVESKLAISYYWGVSYDTVRRWRRALGVPQFNRGTLQLWEDMAPDKLTADVRVLSHEARSANYARRRKRMPDTLWTGLALIGIKLTREQVAKWSPGQQRETALWLERIPTHVVIAIAERVGS